MPATNLDYWEGKIGRNRRRDVETTALLEERGWAVLRFWEHEAPSTVADSIAEAARARREVTRLDRRDSLPSRR